ncbi:MAG: hypothetical protein PVH12_05655, partial [Candidatus Bathyarchaeota archaeon]
TVHEIIKIQNPRSYWPRLGGRCTSSRGFSRNSGKKSIAKRKFYSNKETSTFHASLFPKIHGQPLSSQV